MSSRLLKLYHRLPYPARCLAASARGLQLRRWRYGRETEELVTAALERDCTSRQFLEQEQWRLLHEILDGAARRVPFYRQLWSSSTGEPWLHLERWPVLTKDAVRRTPEAFLADGERPGSLFPEHTSGTTATPLRLWWSPRTVRHWYALWEARARRWYGVTKDQPWAILGGQLVAAVEQRRPPYWVWNAALRQLYLSVYHLSADTVHAYLDALAARGVVHLLGYPSALHALAELALERGIEPPRLTAVVTNAEPLLAHQRAAIAAAFRCPVRETYGLAEAVCGASECEAGRLHLWPEAGIVEVLADDRDEPVAEGQTGRLVCTGLLNPAMPLVRYDTGDRVRLGPRDVVCGCGRTLQVLESVEGRADDMVRTPEGRLIGRLDPVFKGELPIREAQIVQESLGLVRVLVVKGTGFERTHEDSLRHALAARLGTSMTVEIEQVEAIPRSANGKFRAVVSRLSTDPRAEAAIPA